MAEASPLASDVVHSELRSQILDGSLEPGDPVPSERTLADEYGVNRHAVREALKRLQQAGLIRIAQGGATRVLDWRDSGGLGVLLDLMNAPVEPPRELLRSVLEMRVTIGVDAAGKFAARADDEQRRQVTELSARAAEGMEAGRMEALLTLIELWKVVVDGTGNIAYRLALNTLNSALAAYPEIVAGFTPPSADEIRGLGEAMVAGNVAEAKAIAEMTLGRDIAALV